MRYGYPSLSNGGTVSGPLTITATSTSAFLVETASGTDVFKIDTTNAYANFYTKKILINQTVQTGSVQPALQLDSPAHTQIQAGTEANTLYWDTGTVKTWNTGAIAQQRENVWLTPTYAAAGASTMSLALNHDFGGIPAASTNVTISTAFNSLFGDISGAFNLVGGNGGMIGVLMPGIADGVGNTDYLAGIQFLNLGNISLGNQTATTSELYMALYDTVTFVSTTNTRTVTNAYAAMFRKPIAGLNVLFTNTGAARFSGDIKMDGDSYGARFHQGSASITAANDLVLSNYTCHSVSGSTQINAITVPTGSVAGDIHYFYFNDAVTVKNNTAGGAGTAVILLAGGADFSATANDTLTLLWTGTQYLQLGVSVN